MLEDRLSRKLEAGDWLFREGDQGQEAYIIETGCLEIVVSGGDDLTTLARLRPGDIVGEMALVGDRVRTASAIAAEPTTLTVITGDYLRQRVAAADPLIRHILSLVTARYRSVLKGGSGAEVLPDDGTDRDLALKGLRLERELERALERGEFLLCYQPIVDLRLGGVAGFEALIRWKHPERGLVSPLEFIPAAETSGLIVPMGHWIMATAARALNEFGRRRAPSPQRPPLFCSVNLSGRQFADPLLLQQLEAAVRDGGLAPSQLRLEVTESLLVDRLAEAQDLLHRCKAVGVKLSVDDFGTGYSSLAYLQHLPVDTLKVDRSFVRGLADSPATAKIVRAVVGLASDLGMEVVAEGVETLEQHRALGALGTGYGQGFLYGKPREAFETLQLLQQPQAFEPLSA